MNGLSKKERELAALGAAIGANCVSCIEYHIPEARTAGLSDTQILEAVKVAEKVRRVAGARVLGTARAHLEKSESSPEANNHECGCPEEPARSSLGSKADAGTCSGGQAPSHEHKAAVESAALQEDNMRDQPRKSGSEATAEEDTEKEDAFQFAFPQNMKKMMEQCCPERAERMGSMMGRFSTDCCSSTPKPGEEKRQKPTA